ncbi:hypothetical protein GCM10008965_34330 [Methylorubrum aminovorans]|nr:hypothetical protein GCM10025880_04510 [Methylorubrum aminovorans]
MPMSIGCELTHDILEIAEGASEAIDAGDHEGIALTDKIHDRAQLGAASDSGPGDLPGADNAASGDSEGGELEGEVLISGGGARPL